MNTLVFENAHTNGQASTAPPSAASPQSKTGVPDPQVIQKATRRRFSVADKRRILKEADACHNPAELGVLLRREGLYSSSLTSFRKQRAQGRLKLTPPEHKVTQRKQAEAARQRDNRQIVQMQKQIQQLTGLLELQKKLSDLLGIHLEGLTTNECD
jgi:transposase-like protein